jgi:hypothetical protein
MPTDETQRASWEGEERRYVGMVNIILTKGLCDDQAGSYTKGSRGVQRPGWSEE